jgi:hypothetical protein
MISSRIGFHAFDVALVLTSTKQRTFSGKSVSCLSRSEARALAVVYETCVLS